MKARESSAPAAHDVGGQNVGRTIPREQHAFAPWELRTHAMLSLLCDSGLAGGAPLSTDELRRGVEALSPEEYRARSYYERWLLSIGQILTEKGVIDRAALERRIAELEEETPT